MLKLLLLTLGGLKLGKFFGTAITMVVSIATYALVFGFWYAVGFVVLIFIHEMGHFVAARRRGLAVGAPTFIPFVGAWVDLKDQPRSAEVEAYVGLGGPLVGTAASIGCYVLARSYDSPLLLALSYSGFFLNLFNLIPLSPFDGGRITAAISPRLWLVGVPILVGLFFWHPSPLLLLMGLLAAPQVWKAIRFDPKAPENASYYSVSTAKRFEYGFWYLLLAVFLAMMANDTHEMLRGFQLKPGVEI